jgi:hypothetical protein
MGWACMAGSLLCERQEDAIAGLIAQIALASAQSRMTFQIMAGGRCAREDTPPARPPGIRAQSAPPIRATC